MNRKFLHVIVFAVIYIFVAAVVIYANDSVTIEATGKGTTLSAARINARRAAARQALGFLLEGTSIFASMNNSQSIDENILRLTRAFINDEQEISIDEDKHRHIFTVKLRVNVSGAELLDGLITRGSEKILFDGTSYVSDAINRERWKSEVTGALVEVLGNFRAADYVKVTANTIGDFDIHNEEIKLRIDLKFDSERYFTEAVPQITSVLDYVSDASMKDVPFYIQPEEQRDGTLLLNLADKVRTMRQYMKLMEIETENRKIKAGGYANIYIQTQNYYFNAYRVTPDAFRALAEKMFTLDGRGNFSRMNGRAELNISFVSDNGDILPFKPAGIKNMQNVIFFMNVANASIIPFMTQHNFNEERRNALFIFPAFGFENEYGRDYNLWQEDSAALPPIKVSAEKLLKMGKGSMQCSIVFK